MTLVRLFNIYILRLFIINGFILIGILPFYIFVLGTIPTLINGISYENTKISKINIDLHENMGRHNSTCYVNVYFLGKNGITYVSSELCEDFDLENDINKNIYVRIDHGSELRNSIFQRNPTGSGFFNSVLKVEDKEINSKYLPHDGTWTGCFIVGLLCFIRWLQVSLIPRIKGIHPLQIALKNRIANQNKY